jgi:hypothetical protein
MPTIATSSKNQYTMHSSITKPQSPHFYKYYRGLKLLRQSSPPLFWVGLVMLMASVLTLLLTHFDVREFQGVSVWLKPWKFQLSTGAYLLTLGLFMVWLPAQARNTWPAKYVAWIAVVSSIFEVAYISWQAVLGEASHFNTSTPLHAAMYTLMGVGAVLLTSAAGVLGVYIGRAKEYRLPYPLKLAIVLGLISTFVLGTGFGGYLGGSSTGHWVGGALTDAGGLPLVQWSRTGGDLRVAHFFGIHAMHFIPAFAGLLAILQIPPLWATRSVWGFSALFAGGTVWTFVQALNGHPFWS